MNLVELDLPYPPTVNHYYTVKKVKGRPRKILSKKGREYKAIASLSCLQQAGKTRISGTISLWVDVYPPDRRKRDISNIIKPLEDSIAEGLGFDDYLVDEIHVVRRGVEKGGRVFVQIKELG